MATAELTVENAEHARKRPASKPKAPAVPPTFTYSIEVDTGGENGGTATLSECLARAVTAAIYHLREERGRQSVPITIASQCGECRGIGQQKSKRGFLMDPCKACSGQPHTPVVTFDAILPESYRLV